MSAATSIAHFRRHAAPCLPHKSSRAVKRPSRPTPQGTARVLTAELKSMEWALIQFLRHSSVCLYMKTGVADSATLITTGWPERQSPTESKAKPEGSYE